MAVYREGYHFLEQIQKQSIRIYSDACDIGVPVKKNDSTWNTAAFIVKMYGETETRKTYKYPRTEVVSIEIELMDEWAVSDGRKTVKTATEVYVLTFVKTKEGACRNFDGFITISKK